MNGYKGLLEVMKELELITENASKVLKTGADNLIEQWDEGTENGNSITVAGTYEFTDEEVITGGDVDGDVTINYTGSGNVTIDESLNINGNLTVNAPNAAVQIDATVSGSISGDVGSTVL